MFFVCACVCDVWCMWLFLTAQHRTWDGVTSTCEKIRKCTQVTIKARRGEDQSKSKSNWQHYTSSASFRTLALDHFRSNTTQHKGPHPHRSLCPPNMRLGNWTPTLAPSYDVCVLYFLSFFFCELRHLFVLILITVFSMRRLTWRASLSSLLFFLVRAPVVLLLLLLHELRILVHLVLVPWTYAYVCVSALFLPSVWAYFMHCSGPGRRRRTSWRVAEVLRGSVLGGRQ